MNDDKPAIYRYICIWNKKGYLKECRNHLNIKKGLITAKKTGDEKSTTEKVTEKNLIKIHTSTFWSTPPS